MGWLLVAIGSASIGSSLSTKLSKLIAIWRRIGQQASWWCSSMRGRFLDGCPSPYSFPGTFRVIYQTAKVVTTILRLMPVLLFVYSSDDLCGRHIAGREPCRRFSPWVDFSIAL